MELADPRLIGQLQEAFNAKAPRPRRAPHARVTKKGPAPEERVYEPAKNRRRCRCGTCARCKENARWERIFAEKFADPNYYSGPVTRHESPLHTI